MHKIVCIVLIYLYFLVPNITNLPNKAQNNNTQKTRVCIIGAGIAGLSSARHLQNEDVDFIVLESTRYLGGTWRYDSHVGEDENGLPLHTSMYKHLRTNLPKQAMELNGLPVPEDMPSFPGWDAYYQYIKSFAKHYDLYRHIKFLHEVTSVRKEEKVWNVTYRHVVTNEKYNEEFDYMLVCTGHYSKPNWPSIPGENKFKGTIIHSHGYRLPDPFKDRRVLVVGAGPSGMDIGLDVAEVSRTLVHSHHSRENCTTPVRPNFIKKPDIKELTETGAVFVDGSFEEIDDIIYCTVETMGPWSGDALAFSREVGAKLRSVSGDPLSKEHFVRRISLAIQRGNAASVLGFKYHYPFLDESSELIFGGHYIAPLYRYVVNIRQPSMLILGLVVRACVVAAIDAQARYASALILGNFTLPSEEEMMKEWQQRANAVIAKGRPLSDTHLLAEKEDQYYSDLTAESGIARVPPVLFKIRIRNIEAQLENFYTFRDLVYTIVDNDTFTSRYEPPIHNKCCSP